MHSALYVGHVVHHRYRPRPHRFYYPLFMVYLDLAELDQVFRGRWFWSTKRAAIARFARQDHLGDPRLPLDVAVRDLVESQLGWRPCGPIRLLTHLRYFGYIMNPVSFYYCFSPDESHLQAIVADVANTPWNERHRYVLDLRDKLRAGDATMLNKVFHVSPFMPMQQQYEWRFTRPDQVLAVTMRNLQQGQAVFHAVLKLKRRPLTGFNLAVVLLRFPVMTLQVISAIYWQAFLLWLKRTPYFKHPKHYQLHQPKTIAKHLSTQPLEKGDPHAIA